MIRVKQLLLAGAALGLSVAMVGEAAAQKVLRYAEFGPNRGTRAQALNWMAEQIEKQSGDALKLEMHWGKALLGTKVVLKGVADGVADMGSVIGFFTPKELRAYNIGDLPVDNSDEWVGMRALYSLATTHPAFHKEVDKAGVVYVTHYTTGPIQLICSKNVAGLGDLDGAKLRGSGPYGKTFADLGADVQRMGQGKVYQALDSGLIECNQNYYYSMKAYKQYEVAQNVLELNWGQNMAFGIVMNKATHDSLSASEKTVIAEVGSDFVDYLAQLMIDGLAQNKQAMVDGIDGKKINVRTLSGSERSKLLSSGKKYVDAWVGEATKDGLDGKAILAQYEELIAQYAAEQSSKGYPWTR